MLIYARVIFGLLNFRSRVQGVLAFCRDPLKIVHATHCSGVWTLFDRLSTFQSDVLLFRSPIFQPNNAAHDKCVHVFSTFAFTLPLPLLPNVPPP